MFKNYFYLIIYYLIISLHRYLIVIFIIINIKFIKIFHLYSKILFNLKQLNLLIDISMNYYLFMYLVFKVKLIINFQHILYYNDFKLYIL